MQLELSRQETIEILTIRDGYTCMFPDCTEPLTDTGNHMVTLDHIYPQALAKRDGWSIDKINHINNLQLMGKNCNARKGHLIPDENGNLPLKVKEPRALAKSERPVICETCYAGRLLFLGEECYDCGSGPQPAIAPKATQKTPKECTHAGHDHCWMCYLGFVERSSALTNLVTGK
jgi:hypothetical protein